MPSILDLANVITILIGALVSLMVGVAGILYNRSQVKNQQTSLVIESDKIGLEERKLESDDNKAITSGATQLVGATSVAVEMYRSLADEYKAQIENLKIELQEKEKLRQECQGLITKCDKSRARVKDFFDFIQQAIETKDCPIGNPTCIESNERILEYLKRMNTIMEDGK